MNAAELAQPDNSADRTIILAISGNRLVSVLNTLDQLAFAAGNYRFEGNDTVADNEYFRDLRAVTEAIRDELSRQRNSPVPRTSAPMGEIVGPTENIGSTTRDKRARPLGEILRDNE